MTIEGPKKLSGDVPQSVSTAGYSPADAVKVAEAVVNRAHAQIQLDGTSLEIGVNGPNITLKATSNDTTTT
jgi:hypothetical protein